MASGKEIRTQIGSIRSTAKITSAMELVAASNRIIGDVETREDLELLHPGMDVDAAARRLRATGMTPMEYVHTLRLEEEKFAGLLDRGLKLLSEETDKLPEGGVLPGEAAFKLYDTYGFPLDLTRDILRALELIRAAGTTILLATHDPVVYHHAAANRVLHLEMGRLVEDRALDRVPSFVAELDERGEPVDLLAEIDADEFCDDPLDEESEPPLGEVA